MRKRPQTGISQNLSQTRSVSEKTLECTSLSIYHRLLKSLFPVKKVKAFLLKHPKLSNDAKSHLYTNQFA